ncbi:MAG: DUF1499 domain-containing protein [Elusimicrobia bacterium]|nr:DUF1499 domain-containing protein [Elusimicrobiota bacterium]
MILAALAAAAALAAEPQLPPFGFGDDGACGEKPNCVSTLDLRPKRHALPWPYQGSQLAAQGRLERAIESFPRAAVAEIRPGYIHAVFKSAVLRFADDVEFLFPEREAVIHYRSVSRSGYWDLGANRRRMMKLEKAFKEAP